MREWRLSWLSEFTGLPNEARKGNLVAFKFLYSLGEFLYCLYFSNKSLYEVELLLDFVFFNLKFIFKLSRLLQLKVSEFLNMLSHTRDRVLSYRQLLQQICRLCVLLESIQLKRVDLVL